MGNAFNKYFAKVAINIQWSILFFKKKYCDRTNPTLPCLQNDCLRNINVTRISSVIK